VNRTDTRVCSDNPDLFKRRELVRFVSEARELRRVRFAYGMIHAFVAFALLDTLSRIYFSQIDPTIALDADLRASTEKLEKVAKLRMTAMVYSGILYLGLVAWFVSRLVRQPQVLATQTEMPIHKLGPKKEE